MSYSQDNEQSNAILEIRFLFLLYCFFFFFEVCFTDFEIKLNI